MRMAILEAAARIGGRLAGFKALGTAKGAGMLYLGFVLQRNAWDHGPI